MSDTYLGTQDMGSPATTLKPAQLSAIQFLLEGHNNVEVARLVGVSKGTLTNWRKNALFDAELQRQRITNLDELRGRCDGMAHEALDKLRELMRDATPSLQLKAATEILNRAGLIKERVSAAVSSETLPKPDEDQESYLDRLYEEARLAAAEEPN